MKEGGRLDRYFARKDTLLAKSLRKISPKTGEAYRTSRIKRAEDILIAAPLWLMSLPVQAIARSAVWLSDRGATSYIDKRLRRDGDGNFSPFPIKKIRTMYINADAMTVDPLLRSTSKDPRVTKVGKILRRTNIDELPQLWSVVTGKLSLVGVRAINRYSHEDLISKGLSSQEWEKAYTDAKPGIIGLRAAYEGKYRKDASDANKIPFDLYYAKHASLGLDLYTIWRLIFVDKKPYNGMSPFRRNSA